MTKWLLSFVALLAPFLFPMSFTFGLALLGSIWTPWIPLAVGLVADALYFSPDAFSFPLYSLLGAGVTVIAFGVHRFIETSIMPG